ncbi:MAG: hypothetical protein H7333_08650 [Bdellovibrionales bacterium]|nr:hypothetical protein [Oligoflexia bacterium]
MYPPCYAPSQKSLADTDSLDLRLEVLFDEIEYDVKAGNKCILVLTVSDREELSAVVNSLFHIKKELKERKVVAIAFMKFASDNVEELLIRSGVTDILRFDTSAKAFTYKLKRHLKFLEQEQISNDGIELLTGRFDEDGELNARALRAKQLSDERKSKVSLVDALRGDQDFWLFGGRKYARRLQDSWVIEMVGPGAQAGTWQKVDDSRWRWVPQASQSAFNPAIGHWVFAGSKPIYSWTLNRWGFVSKRPDLSLIEKDAVILTRFALADPFHLQVAENSEHARSIFKEIKGTYVAPPFPPDSNSSLIPWQDHTNSAQLATDFWMKRHRQSETHVPALAFGLEQILMGEDAMRTCGIHGRLKGLDIDLIEYNEGATTLRIGIENVSVQKKEIVEISVELDNLGLANVVILRGIVTSVEPEGGEGRKVALVLMLQESSEEFKKISESVSQRQEEVFSFFKRVKGLG